MELSANELHRNVDGIVQEVRFGKFGYAVIRGMIDPSIVSEARSVVERSLPCRLGSLIVRLARLVDIKMTPRTFDLVSRSKAFVKLLDNEALHKVILGVCGEGAKCGSFHANIVPPKPKAEITSHNGSFEFIDDSCLAQELHIDFPYGNGHAGFLEGGNPPEKAPSTCQVLWMLDDFTLENGATIVVPGTHKHWRAPKDDDEDMKYAIENHARITGRAGDVLIYSGQLWHAVPHNHSTSSRVAVLGQFLPYYFLSMEDHAYATPDGVLRSLPPRVQSLLKEHVAPAGMWIWIFASPVSLVRRVGDVVMSPLGLLGVSIMCASNACLYNLQLNKVALILATSGIGFLMGCFSTLTNRDLKSPTYYPQTATGAE